MNASQLLCELEARGATVAPSGDSLDIEAPRGVLTPKVLAAVKEQKQALLQVLAALGATPKNPPASTCSFDVGRAYQPFRAVAHARKLFRLGKISEAQRDILINHSEEPKL
jgi:hypothetical protein